MSDGGTPSLNPAPAERNRDAPAEAPAAPVAVSGGSAGSGPAHEALTLGDAVRAAGGSAEPEGSGRHPENSGFETRQSSWATGGVPFRGSRTMPSTGCQEHCSGLGAPAGGPPSPAGGSWTWHPAGMEPKRPWRRRHPVLFVAGVVLLLALVFGIGRVSVTDAPISGPRIAVIQVEGMILDAEDLVAFMDKVRKDSSFRAAVLRINSPGGAVGPSQEIYAAAKRLALVKPVVASMGSVAASGGYYAALGARKIIAGPSSLTASIGVKMQLPNVAGLMRTIGISETTLATGKLKDAGSAWREMTPEEEAYLRSLLTDMYEEFIAAVGRERDLSPEKVRAVADGRAMTGRQALEAGLVDALGDFSAAVSAAKEFAGLPADEEIPLIKGPEKQRSLLTRLLESAMHTVRQQSVTAEQPVFLY